MPALIDAIDIKRKMYFEFENAPYYCLDVEVSTPTARGGQTLVRLKMRNLLTRAVFDKTFKAGEKFKEPDLETVEASYLYSDGEGSLLPRSGNLRHHQPRPEQDSATRSSSWSKAPSSRSTSSTATPSACSCPRRSSSPSTYTEPGARGNTASGDVTKHARLETGLEIRVPFFIEEGEKVKVYTETREFAGRA